MRTRWLKWGLCCTLLLAACGRQPDGLSQSGVQTETAELRSVTSVSPEAEKVFSAPMAAPTDGLPPLPFADKRLKVASAVSTVTRDGSNSYTAGGGAANVATSKLLTGGPAAMSWAVYQLPGLPASTQLQKLVVDVSGGVFGGNAPGFWVGMADFVHGKWVTLNRAQDDYQRLLSGHDYVSANGNLYVFVLVEGAQTVSVDSVALTYDTVPPSGWAEITLDSSASGGWTPAIALDYYGSVWLAWSDHEANEPRYAYGIATADLQLLNNWETGVIDPAADNKGYYTDLVMDQRTNLPVVSLNYVEQSAGADNSLAGMSVFRIGPQGQHQWFNFSFPTHKMDGAQDTTIDFDPVSSFFGIVTSALNTNSPAKQPGALYVRYIDLGNLAITSDDVIKVNPDLDSALPFPHLRFNPASQRTRINAAGATLYSDESAPSMDDPTWTHTVETASAGAFGSLAYNPAPTGPRYGITYSKDVGINHVLFYNEYSAEGGEADVQQVAAISKTGGPEFIGGTSQLAYTFEGKPLIAYTVRTAGTVDVKLAYKSGSNWVSQKVNAEPSEPGSTPQDVQVDLAVEPYDYFPDFPRTNRAFVVWHDIYQGEGSLKVAWKGI